MLCARQASVVRGGRKILDHLSFSLEPGTMHVLLGGNGAGKSSLLKLLAGEIAPDSGMGSVELDERDLKRYSPAALAQRRAVLPQLDELRFPFTAFEVVSLGRLSVTNGQRMAEARVIRQCLEATDASHLTRTHYTSLSGGERARVQLARVLAQVWGTSPQARYLLLDEPTAALDIAHQHSCMQLCQTLAQQGLGVLVVLHDLNLALHYANRITLMKQGQILATGDIDSTMTPDLLARCFGSELSFTRVDALGRTQLLADFRRIQR